MDYKELNACLNNLRRKYVEDVLRLERQNNSLPREHQIVADFILLLDRMKDEPGLIQDECSNIGLNFYNGNLELCFMDPETGETKTYFDIVIKFPS